MKAITVRQPWAWAILHGGKDVENRTRNIAGSYRGPLVIHAGLALDKAATLVPPLKSLPVDPFGIEGGLVRGVALGVVELSDTHAAPHCPGRMIVVVGDRYTRAWPDPETCSPWAEPNTHHLVLANPRPFPEPIPYKGALGLWNFPDELLPEGF